MAQTTETGATRNRPTAATIPDLEARVTDLRAHVEKTAAALARAEEWDREQYTRCSGENLREARYEHGLAKSGLARAEQQLAEAKGGAAS